MKKKIVVCGGGGFIGGHLAKTFIDEGYQVRCVDRKPMNQWYQLFHEAENLVLNLQGKAACYQAVNGMDEVYNLAADMGGMGFIENNKALCMLSVLINTHLLETSHEVGIKKFFYASSACVYAADKQTEVENPGLKESDAYPAMPEDGYGWEKLFSERMCRHFREDFGMHTRAARFHNVYGPWGTYDGGREKAPAALSRKVILAHRSGKSEMEIWGDGEQTRSFMYIDDCIKGIRAIMDHENVEPLNLGSEEMVSINQLVDIIEKISGTALLRTYNLDAPKGVRGRSSDNTLFRQVHGWEPSISLREGLEKTYRWIEEQIAKSGPETGSNIYTM